jgi:hypothetical protein
MINTSNRISKVKSGVFLSKGTLHFLYVVAAHPTVCTKVRENTGKTID